MPAANVSSVAVSCVNTMPPGRYSTVDSYPITDCVKDDTTGLIWEGKPTSGFRASTNTYTNYDSTTALQYWNGYSDVPPVTLTQSQIDAATNSIGYKNAVNASALCGYTNWRLPTKTELLGLVSGSTYPTIDTTWFPNTDYWYWTSTPYEGYAEDAWGVHFVNGIPDGSGLRASSGNLRLVRSNTYTLGGSVNGLTASGLVLATGGESVSVAANASSFSLVNPIASGASYNVVVESQPSGLNCTVSSGSGIMSAANVSSVAVSCVPTTTGRYSTVGSYPITDCVKDNTTGLTWEGKPTSGFRASGGSYTNFDSTTALQYSTDHVTFVTPTQSQIDAATNSIGYKTVVNTSALCGYTNWRLPTLTELQSLLLPVEGEPNIDTIWFPNTQKRYWTSTPYQDVARDLAYHVYFGDGDGAFGYRHRYLYLSAVGPTDVRLVRSTTNLGGRISGLTANGLMLVSGSQTITVAANASSFSFPIAIAEGMAYSVVVESQPSGLICTVSNGSGTMSAADVSTVSVSCVSATPTGRYSTVGSYPITDCVKDNTTGLTWEGKPTSGLRASTNTYTNYDSTTALKYWNGSTNVTPTQSQIDVTTNSMGYKNAVNAWMTTVPDSEICSA